MVASGYYRHYKGGLYFVPEHATMVFTGNSEDLNGQPLVPYHALYPDGLPMGMVRLRPESEWNEQVMWHDGKEHARFAPEEMGERVTLKIRWS